MVHELMYLAPAQSPTVDPLPCETCAHCIDPGACTETDLGLSPGWPRLGGRLLAEHFGSGRRCPRWRRKES
jgi:hypothetical protein